ncbi:MAG: MarR family transcriptional regulator, partial [Methanoregulaceae archaeon]|nr:MarR family transcriptional regulator [Methanoregulaceae archaeon]
MKNDRLDRAADDLLTMMPFYHKHIMKTGYGITGLQSAQYRVLGVLMKAGTLPVSEIGRRLYISKPYMTALIDTLIEGGFVQRQPDLTDRRVINITITEQGKKYLKQSVSLYKKDLKELLSVLGDTDLEELCTSLESLK